MHRVLKAMVIAQHHAHFGLAVMVENGHPQVVAEPADHLRVQRLAGTADHPQRPLILLAKASPAAISRR